MLLVSDIAEKAADGQGVARVLTLAEAELEVKDSSVRGVMSQGRAIDGFAIECAAKECGDIAAYRGQEELFERVELEECVAVFSEEALPGGIGIEEAARRAERRDHLAGTFEEVTVSFL